MSSIPDRMKLSEASMARAKRVTANETSDETFQRLQKQGLKKPVTPPTTKEEVDRECVRILNEFDEILCALEKKIAETRD